LGGATEDKNEMSMFSQIWKLKEWMLAEIPSTRNFYTKLHSTLYKRYYFPKMRDKLLSDFQKSTGIAKEKVEFIDHHTAHAYSAYFGSPDYWEGKKLVLTLDAMGDGVCATVSLGKKEKLKRISTTLVGNSIGDLYAFVTRYLGMKMGEHEYKVMGMAAYANEKYVDKVYDKIKDWVTVDKKNLSFETKVHSHVFYKILNKPFDNERFDNISGAIQKLTEKVMAEWVSEAVKKTRVGDVVCGGGVFMNVKANQKIVELPEVRSFFVMPSSGDESTAIGAAFVSYQDEREINCKLPKIQPIEELYYGPEYSNAEILKELKMKKYNKYKIRKVPDIELEIAKMISKRKIVARFAGRMEWGGKGAWEQNYC